MCSIQLLREKVYERLSAAAEDLLQRLESGEAPAGIPALRPLLSQQLAAAAEEVAALVEETVAALVEETVAEPEDRAERSEEEIERRREVWDALLKPEVKLRRTGQFLHVLSPEAMKHASALLHNKSQCDFDAYFKIKQRPHAGKLHAATTEAANSL